MTLLILEGVRRYDEFNRAAAVAPDHVRVKPTGKPRTPLADGLHLRRRAVKTDLAAEEHPGVRDRDVRRLLPRAPGLYPLDRKKRAATDVSLGAAPNRAPAGAELT
jgi:hypothetical protein